LSNLEKLTGYVGTYTKGDSEGIYRFILNTKLGKIEHIQLAGKVDNPTYLSITKDNKFIYSVSKIGDLGGVTSFSVEKETGMLQQINDQGSAGSPPCHLSTNTNNTVLLTANYHKGTIEVHPVNTNTGEIQPPSSIATHTGSGPDPRQEKAHTHYSGFTPDEKYFVAVELGIDKIFTYQLVDNQITQMHELSVKAGSGPRHIVFHPTLPLAYVMTEFSSEVLVLKYNANDGSFEEIQALSTLPSDFTVNNQGSAIHISSDGRFVYAGNRGHNSIASFVVDSTGMLTFLEHTHTEGDWPRDFSLDPTETYLIASNQESSNLVLFARDKETGKLHLLQSDITVPDPVCVKFLSIFQIIITLFLSVF